MLHQTKFNLKITIIYSFSPLCIGKCLVFKPLFTHLVFLVVSTMHNYTVEGLPEPVRPLAADCTSSTLQYANHHKP